MCCPLIIVFSFEPNFESVVTYVETTGLFVETESEDHTSSGHKILFQQGLNR